MNPDEKYYKPDKKNKYPLVELDPEKIPLTVADEDAIENGYYFDERAAKRVINFFERYLKHTISPYTGKPFLLLDWQKYNLIAPLFGWKRPDGTRRFRVAYVEIPKKNGKALALNTLIPTPAGWKTMGNLMPGDEVFDAKGAPCTVVAATDVMEWRPCYRVSFSDGTSVIADAEHLWRTHTRKPENHYDIWTTKELAESLFLDYKGSEGYNHSIRMERCLELPPQKLEIHPYVLGCWLGDGTSKSANITTSYEDMEILENIERCGVSVSERKSSNPNSGSFILGSNGRGKERFFSLQAKLRKLGVLRNKHIPMQYLRADPSQRRTLLQGLMDTDGYVSKAGQCEFTTTSKPLCEGFLDLARGLGYKPTLKTCRATLNGVDCGEKYRVQFWGFREQVVFGLSRKQERLKPIPKKRPRSKTVHIIAVEPVPSVPVRCIQVSSPDGMFLCGEGMIPTHNSMLCSGISLYLLCADGEQGGQIYAVAAERSQAGIVFDESAKMIYKSPALKKRLNPTKSTKTIYHAKSNSIYKALSAEAPTKEGLNIHGLIFDELHAQAKRDLWDTLRYGGAARDQPLIISITTAGYDRTTICWEQHEYARRILKGQIFDPSFFALIYSTNWEDAEARNTDEEEVDWRSEEAWYMANPSLGYTIKLDDFRQECLAAQESPQQENTFKRYRLNIWTRAETRWFGVDKWKACGEEFDIEMLKNRRCFGGLDMASVEDLASFSLVFEPGEDGLVYVLNWSFCPLENLWKRVKKQHVPYDRWVEDGYLIATDGNAIDEEFILKKIKEIKDEFRNLQLIGFDRWGALSITVNLEKEGLKVIPIGQGFTSLSAPSKALERYVLDETLRHGDNPVLSWAADNVVIAKDAAENIKPVKNKSTEKIDPIVSMVNAIAAMQHAAEMEEESIYKQRGIITL